MQKDIHLCKSPGAERSGVRISLPLHDRLFHNTRRSRKKLLLKSTSYDLCLKPGMTQSSVKKSETDSRFGGPELCSIAKSETPDGLLRSLFEGKNKEASRMDWRRHKKWWRAPDGAEGGKREHPQAARPRSAAQSPPKSGTMGRTQGRGRTKRKPRQTLFETRSFLFGIAAAEWQSKKNGGPFLIKSEPFSVFVTC